MTTLLSSLLTPAESTSTRWNSATLLALKPAEWLTGLDTVLLTPGRHTIGSDADCTVVLNSAGVRPQHCLIVVGPKRTVLKAWDAFTWLNEAPVAESELKPGDRIAIGPVEFIVRNSTADELIDLKLETPADHSTTRTALQDPRQDQSAETVSVNSSSSQANDQLLDSAILPVSRAEQVVKDSSVLETEGGQLSCVEPDAATTERLRKQTEDTTRQHAELKAQLQDLRIDIAEQELQLQQMRDATDKVAKESEYATVAIATESETAAVQLRRERESLARQANDTAIEAAMLSQTAERATKRACDLADREHELLRREQKLISNEADRSQIESHDQERQQRIVVAEQDIDHKTHALEQLQDELQQSEASIEEELQALRQQVESWSREQDEARVLIESRLSAVAKFEADMADTQSEVDEHSSANQTLETRLDDERTDLDLRETELASEFDRVTQQQEEVRQRSATLDEERRRSELQLQEQAEALEEVARQTEELTSRDTMLGRRELELDERQSDLETKRLELESHEQSEVLEEVAHKADDFDKRETAIERQELEIVEQQSDLEAKRSELESQAQDIVERTALMTTRLAEIDERELRLTESEVSMEQELQQVLAERNDIQQHSRELNEREQQLQRDQADTTDGAADDSDPCSLEESTNDDETPPDDTWGAVEPIPEATVSTCPPTNEEAELPDPISDWTPVAPNVSEPVDNDPMEEIADTNTDSDEFEDLRSSLADMFDMTDAPTDQVSEAVQPNDESSDDVSDTSSPPSEDSSESSRDTSPSSVWETMFPEEDSQEEQSEVDDKVVTAEPMADREATSPSGLHLEDADDSESVANYMKGLLARSRREHNPDESGMAVPDRASSPSESIVNPVQAIPPTEEQPLDTHAKAAASTIEADEESESVCQESLAPRHQQDRDAVRADLATMREVANRSARSAIATSTWKRLRGKLFVKSVLAVVSLTISAVLLTGKLWGTVSYTGFGWAFLAIGGITAVELINSTLLLHRLNAHVSENSRVNSSQPQSNDGLESDDNELET